MLAAIGYGKYSARTVLARLLPPEQASAPPDSNIDPDQPSGGFSPASCAACSAAIPPR